MPEAEKNARQNKDLTEEKLGGSLSTGFWRLDWRNSVSISLCLVVSLPARLSVCLSDCLSMSVSHCPSASVCLSVSYCLSMSVSHCASACLSVRHSHIIEWPAVLTCFLSLNLAPSRCIMYLLSTWHPACRTCTSREDNEATVKLKQPCSTNFRQSTWKSSKQKKINTIAVKLNFMLQFSDCQTCNIMQFLAPINHRQLK